MRPLHDMTFPTGIPVHFGVSIDAILTSGRGAVVKYSVKPRLKPAERLGVNDTATVGGFLNISPNSIYVYKASLKAKSSLSKADFDSRVMAIKKP